jgi:hypothetical protein
MAPRIPCVLLLTLLPPLASAGPPPAGGEIAVNTYTTNAQSLPDVAVDAAGRFVVVWRSVGQDGDGYGVFGQRFSASGSRLGAEFQVNVYTPNSQDTPQVASDPAGNFMVVWSGGGAQDGSGSGIFGRRFNSDGTGVGGEFQVNTVTALTQISPSVSLDAAGNAVIVWTSEGADGSSSGIRARRFAASGTAVGVEFGVNTFTAGPQSEPSVASHADGRFVVSWTSFAQDGSAGGVFGRRFDAGGTALGSEFQVNTFVTQAQDAPKVATLAGGAFVVVWQSNQQTGPARGIFARRYDELGDPASGEIAVNTFTADAQQFPGVAADGAGGFTVVWEGWAQEGSEAGVFARSFDAAGTPAGAEFVVNTYTLYSQRTPAISGDGRGRFVVAWASGYQDGDGTAIRAQRFSDLIFADGFE